MSGEIRSYRANYLRVGSLVWGHGSRNHQKTLLLFTGGVLRLHVTAARDLQQPCEQPQSGTRPTAARQFATNPEDWGRERGCQSGHYAQQCCPSCQITDLAKSVFTRNSLAGSREPRWRAQLSGGSNWDSGRPGGARGDHAATRLGPRARCRGAHETASPELWGSIATP